MSGSALTVRSRDCDTCGKALPTPRLNSKRTCDECLKDPARLAAQRGRANKRKRGYYAAERASRPAPTAEMRECPHQQEKNGPLCGAKFEAVPVLDKKGFTRAVRDDQQLYCPTHRTPSASHRRWFLRLSPKKQRKLVRKSARTYEQNHPGQFKQNQAAYRRRRRAWVALGRKLQAAGDDPKKILRAIVMVCWMLRPKASFPQVREILKAASEVNDKTIQRARTEAKADSARKGRPAKS